MELVVELRGERLVGRDHQRRPVHAGDDVRHRERLARAGDAEQDLVALGHPQPFAQAIDGGRLIPLRLEAGHELEAPACAHLPTAHL